MLQLLHWNSSWLQKLCECLHKRRRFMIGNLRPMIGIIQQALISIKMAHRGFCCLPILSCAVNMLQKLLSKYKKLFPPSPCLFNIMKSHHCCSSDTWNKAYCHDNDNDLPAHHFERSWEPYGLLLRRGSDNFPVSHLVTQIKTAQRPSGSVFFSFT